MEDIHDEIDRIKELIKEHGLEEDEEHVIINLKNSRGSNRKIYLLKRPYMRIVMPDGRFVDYPLRDIVEAIIRYPHLRLSESLLLKRQD